MHPTRACTYLSLQRKKQAQLPEGWGFAPRKHGKDGKQGAPCRCPGRPEPGMIRLEHLLQKPLREVSVLRHHQKERPVTHNLQPLVSATVLATAMPGPTALDFLNGSPSAILGFPPRLRGVPRPCLPGRADSRAWTPALGGQPHLPHREL